MSRLYVDTLFASQPSRKVWSASTPSAEVVDPSDAYATIALALADADAETVIRVAAGSYAVPATLSDSVIQIEGCGSTTILTGPTEIAEDSQIRIENLSFTGDWNVLGKAGFLRVTVGADASLTATGCDSAVVCAEHSGTRPQAAGDGAIAVYPAARFPIGGPGSRRTSEYRLLASLEAPAMGRTPAKGEDRRWVWLKDFKVRRQEQTGREGLQGALQFADTSGVFYCRGGVPLHANMRIRLYGQIYEIKGVSQSPSPENEIAIFVNERLKGV